MAEDVNKKNTNEDTLGKALFKVILYAVVLVLILAAVNWVFHQVPSISSYEVYAAIIVTLIVGWLIINAVASLFYAIFKPIYGKSAASAIKSLVRILGIGGLFVGIAGSVTGGVAGVALGGFIGMVIGFASQQVLGQAMAGIFLLLARPFKHGDTVSVAGEDNVTVEDVSSLFTVVKRNDGKIVLIPNNTIIGQKIVIVKRAEE